jgi:hypothetical protein
MNAKDYWQLFVETGAPELYLMYTTAQKSEDDHVPERSGSGAAGHGLQ